jgi:hypothetical protein
MKRPTLAAVAVAVLFPGAALAQNPPLMESPSWGPRFQVTPFLGFAPIVSRLERWSVTGPGGTAAQNYEIDLGTGMAGGLSVEVNLIDRFALIGSGLFITRGRTTETAQDEGGVQFQHEGSNFIIAKGALAIRLQEQTSELQVHQLSGTVFVGPAYIREMPKNDVLADAVLLQPLSHYGLNFGVDAVIPTPYSRLGLQLGAEDYVVWWNAAELARRNDAVFANNGYQTTSRLETDPSHHFVLRAGLSLQIR